MSSLFVCWILFPLLLGLIVQGCGTVVERLAGRRLELGVRIPCGLALLIAVMDLAVRSKATADLAVPAVVVLAAIGLALSPPWKWRLAQPGLVAAGIVFAAYAAPVVMSGMATFTGFIKLDDTATWLALVDRALSDGHSLVGLPPSTYRAVLEYYLEYGYPLGSFLPLGLGHTLLGEDIAWLVNPWMAFMAGTLAVGLHRIAKLALGDRTGRAAPVAIAALAAQPALLYGYYLWGGIKEMAGAVLIVAFALAAPLALSGERRLRAMIPVGLVLWAIVSALSPGGLVWVGPGCALALASWGVIAWVRRSHSGQARAEPSSTVNRSRSGDSAVRQRAANQGSSTAKRAPRPSGSKSTGLRSQLRGWLERRGLAGLRSPRGWALMLVPLAAAGLGAYLVLRPGGFVERFSSSLTGSHELGNLLKPLSVKQLAGIWPVGDFRYPPTAPGLTDVLVVLVVLFAIWGLGLALRDGRREFVLYVLCAVSGALLVNSFGSPWVSAKAFASAAPALPFAALTALAWLGGGAGLQQALAWLTDKGPRGRAGARGALAGWRAVASLELAAAIAVGILWSNVLAYHDANLAPREQFAELAEIGERIAGEGPTFMTEFQTYAVRHFLRNAAPEAASELRFRYDRLISGKTLETGTTADIDQFALSTILPYRTIVLQRSPVESRPPSPYRLIYADRFWEVWQRPTRLVHTVRWHLPLGDGSYPGSVPNCSTLLRLAKRAGTAELVAEPVENPVVEAVGLGTHSAQLSTYEDELMLNGAGRATLKVTVPSMGRYSVWLGGSTRGPLSIYVGGRLVSTAGNELQESGQYIPFGEIALTAGTHAVELRYGGDGWRPGVGGQPTTVGPIALRRETGTGDAMGRAPLIYVPASHASELCGRTLDWVEGIS